MGTTDWVALWRAAWGNLPDQRATAIEECIAADVPGVVLSELRDAIKAIATRHVDGKVSPAPDLATIIAVIIERRNRAGRYGGEMPENVRDMIRALQEKPVDGMARWDALCDVPREYRGAAITACIQSGGLRTPWWAPHIPGAIREAK